jgi:hypothetical protein
MSINPVNFAVACNPGVCDNMEVRGESSPNNSMRCRRRWHAQSWERR